jgi:hypothetical protein
MISSNSFKIAQPPGPRKSGKRISAKKKSGLSIIKEKKEEHLSYDQFGERYGLQQVNDPVVSATINAYVDRNNLQNKNWAQLCASFDRLLAYLGNDNPIFSRLIYSICDKSLREESYKVKGGARRTIKGTVLRKITVREQNRKHREFMAGIQNVIDHLWERAPFLQPYPGDERNPLSGRRLRELLWQLKALKRAELEIEKLKKEDKGKKARYAHDPVTGEFERVGTAIVDPSTVLLVYVWKAKEELTGSGLSAEDYKAIASLMTFWKFFPSDIGSDSVEQVTLLKDRIKYYKDKDIRFHHSEWSQEYHPMVYVD